jgi:hypothetical protein
LTLQYQELNLILTTGSKELSSKPKFKFLTKECLQLSFLPGQQVIIQSVKSTEILPAEGRIVIGYEPGRGIFYQQQVNLLDELISIRGGKVNAIRHQSRRNKNDREN